MVTFVLLLVQAYSVFAQEGNNGEAIGIGTDPGTGNSIIINSISPKVAPAGSQVRVIIKGSGFGLNPIIILGTDKISFTYVSRTNNEVVADFTISSSIRDGFYNVSVCNTTNGLLSTPVEFAALVPHHLKVISDEHGVVRSCQNVTVRILTLRVVSSTNNIVGQVPVKERFTTVTQNTCGNGQPMPSVCAVTDNSLGDFTDFITTNCPINSVSGECGYDINYNWQWCPTGATAISIGRFNEVVRNTRTTVNGVTTPDRIPTNTNIFP
ncbi:MAG: hypothetical protein JNN15_19635 [Blastocatellia bacterium]|nr:hypothetical protein [Blastocatellia bacterium]